MDDLVKIVTPTIDDVPYASEGLWAVPRELAAGLYQVQSVAFFTDGVSAGDVVRCEPNGEHRLVAVEVVERSRRVTLVLSAATEDGTATDDELRRLARDLQDRFTHELDVEGGMGLLAIVFDRAIEPEVIGAIANHGLGDGSIDGAEQRLGAWYFHTVTYPDRPVPERLSGSDELLAATVDLVAVDWPREDDDLVARWPTGLVEHLRDAAATDARLRAALDDRRYLAAVVPALRRALGAELGMELVGPQTFPLYPARGHPDEVASADERFELEWAVATTDAGSVQWCRDLEADRRFRAELVSLGLDPDADPRVPVRD